MSAALCPRCGRPEHPMFGTRLTALSRKAKVAVCSSCGTDEASRHRRRQNIWPGYPNPISGEGA